ncbi:DEAD/DEAH box helicase, partial [Klebsiella pneumoniae]|uniref:DEAD/DEAH box helicase n=1 Tax=Klebsiella pneumoniae TaxID=573 RepID=UPI001E4E8B33
PFPAELDFNICQALRKQGIGELYTHQAQSFQKALANKHFVAITPTAAGTSLCYNLPVLQEIAASPHSRALYLFPTKALAQDQMSDLHGMIADTGMDIKCHTYDGDTAPQIRTSIRKAGHIV